MGMKGDRGQPVALKKFRLTSADRNALDAAAALYGGKVQPWTEQQGQWELFLEKEELPILICDMPVDQWYELWSAGGCQRRCDGETDQLSNNKCTCDPEDRECSMVTRMKVMLPDLPAVGVWRLETGGYYAATELPGIVELFRSQAREALAGRCKFPEASLAIERRTVKKPGEVTKNFIVPAIRIKQSLLSALQRPRALSAGDQAAPPELAAADEVVSLPVVHQPDPPDNLKINWGKVFRERAIERGFPQAVATPSAMEEFVWEICPDYQGRTIKQLNNRDWEHLIDYLPDFSVDTPEPMVAAAEEEESDPFADEPVTVEVNGSDTTNAGSFENPDPPAIHAAAISEPEVSATAPLWEGPGTCPSCKCPKGSKHSVRCKLTPEGNGQLL